MEGAEGVWVYFAVFGGLLGAGMGLPIPEELPVVIGGAAAGQASTMVPREHPYWWILWPICIVGVVISDGILYCIGRYGGARLLSIGWVQRRLLRPDKRAKIEENFHKYGVKILLGARFLPGIRAPIFVMSGVLKMPLAKFLLADGLYAIPGVTTLFFLAFWFMDRFVNVFKRVQDRVEGMTSLIIILVMAAAGGYFFYAYKRRSVVTGDPHEIPILGSSVSPIEEESPEDGERTVPDPGG